MAEEQQAVFNIEKLDWMSPETKKKAQAKLDKFTPKIGYPKKWRDYSKLEILRGDLVGNMDRTAEKSLNSKVSRCMRKSASMKRRT